MIGHVKDAEVGASAVERWRGGKGGRAWIVKWRKGEIVEKREKREMENIRDVEIVEEK